MFWQSLKIAILNYIKGAAFKSALEILIKKILKSVTWGGFNTWLLKIFVKEALIDGAIEPAVKKAFRELGYVSNKVEGKIEWKVLNENEQDGDLDGYNDSVDDIMR